MNVLEQPVVRTEPRADFSVRALGAAALLVVALIASHGSTFAHMADRWAHDPQYSHGFVVPLFALVVLWSRRDMLAQVAWQPAWIGLGRWRSAWRCGGIAVGWDIEPLDSLSLLADGVRAGAFGRRLVGAALVLAGAGVPGVHDAVAVLAWRWRWPMPLAPHRHRDEHLRSANARLPGPRGGEHHLHRRHSARRRGGVQRPGHADDVFRPGDRAGYDRQRLAGRSPGAGRQRDSDRHPRQRDSHHARPASPITWRARKASWPR